MYQLEIKVLDIVDARCNHEVYMNLQKSLQYSNFWNGPSKDVILKS